MQSLLVRWDLLQLFISWRSLSHIGLMTSGYHFQHADDMNDRYLKMRQAAKEFSIIQYGVCAFKKVDDRHYVAKPFNFFIFGGDTEGMTSQRTFLSNASSLQFLREHKFDFNKLIDGGIPFYNYSETGIESKGYRGTTRTVINRQNHIDCMLNIDYIWYRSTYSSLFFLYSGLAHQTTKEVPANDKVKTILLMQVTWFSCVVYRSNIDHWLQHGKARSPLLVQTNNSFIRRLLHQELQHPYVIQYTLWLLLIHFVVDTMASWLQRVVIPSICKSSNFQPRKSETRLDVYM